jgi:transposase
MPAKKYIVELSDEERAELQELTSKGKQAARKMKRAQILLKSGEGWKDKDIIAALNTSRSTVERTRRRYVEGGLEKALNEDPRPGARRKLDGRGEAYLIALACRTVRQVLKKTS